MVLVLGLDGFCVGEDVGGGVGECFEVLVFISSEGNVEVFVVGERGESEVAGPRGQVGGMESDDVLHGKGGGESGIKVLRRDNLDVVSLLECFGEAGIEDFGVEVVPDFCLRVMSFGEPFFECWQVAGDNVAHLGVARGRIVAEVAVDGYFFVVFYCVARKCGERFFDGAGVIGIGAK